MYIYLYDTIYQINETDKNIVISNFSTPTAATLILIMQNGVHVHAFYNNVFLNGQFCNDCPQIGTRVKRWIIKTHQDVFKVDYLSNTMHRLTNSNY